jgi:hypothetical protein
MPRRKKVNNEIEQNEIKEVNDDVIINTDNEIEKYLPKLVEKLKKKKPEKIVTRLSNLYKCPQCRYEISKLMQVNPDNEVRKCDNGLCQKVFVITYEKD